MKLKEYNLWTALVTPLTPGLKVDFDSLAKIVKEQTDAKNGLLILGSTGEALNLSTEMKKEIVQFVLSLRPSSPLMIGVGGHDLSSQLAWTKWLETKKIQAYLMVTPIYSKPNDQGQFEWFKALMDSVTRPVMLYNVPGRAAKDLSLKAVSQLSSHPNFWGIKEASGNVDQMKDYLKACSQNNGKVFCGDDGLMFEFAQAGSCGLISVASNTWPKETNLYVEQCLKQNLKEKRLWIKAANSLFTSSNPIPAKALLTTEGRISSDTMMPPLSSMDMVNLHLIEQYSQNIKDWFKNNK